MAKWCSSRHRCNNRLCINPDHLELGSRGVENGMWAVQNGGYKAYSRDAMDAVRDLEKKFPDATPEQASDILKDVADDLKDKVDAAGGVVE